MKSKIFLLACLFSSTFIFAQNVGIGTTTPSTNLDVNGTIRIRGGAPAAGKALQTDATGLATWSAEGLLPSSAIVFSDNPSNTNLLNNGFQYIGKTSSSIMDTSFTNAPIQSWIDGTEGIIRIAPKVLNAPNNKFTVFGRFESNDNHYRTATYDPILDKWTDYSIMPDIDLDYKSYQLIVMANDKLVVWGGVSQDNYFTSGKIFDATTDTWTSMSNVGAPSGRMDFAFGFDSVSNKIWIWGGRTYNNLTSTYTYLNSGYTYNLTTDTWAAMNVTGVPTAKALMGFATGGGKAFLCGGLNGTTYYSSSFTYTFATNTWTFLPSTSSIGARASYICHYTGTKFLAWGGNDATLSYKTGALYDLTNNNWTMMGTTGASSVTNQENSTFNNNVFYCADSEGSGKYNVATNSWSVLDNTKDQYSSLAANSVCMFAYCKGTDVNPITQQRKGERFFYSAQPIRNNYFVEKNLFLYKKN